MTIGKKIALFLLTSWALVATVLRSWRMPNDFAEAHWLLDYQFGFVKRGLPGQVLTWACELLGAPVSAELIAHVASTFSIILYVALLYISWRIIIKTAGSHGSILISIAFLCSPFIVMSAHVNGYYDSIVIIMGIAALYLLHHYRVWAGSILLVISVFVHENTIFLTYPVFCFSWHLVNTQRKQAQQSTLPAYPLLLPAMAFISVLLGMMNLDGAQFMEQYSAKLSAFPFVQADRNVLVPEWLLAGVYTDNTPHMGEFLLHLGSLADHHSMAPSMIITLVFIGIHFVDPEDRLQVFMLLVLVLLPQLLHLVAWDTHRIWTYSILTTYLSLWVYAENKPAQGHQPAMEVLYILLVLLNIAMLTPLMDQEYDQLYDLDKRLLFFGPVIAGCFVLLLFPKRLQRPPVPKK